MVAPKAEGEKEETDTARKKVEKEIDKEAGKEAELSPLARQWMAALETPGDTATLKLKLTRDQLPVADLSMPNCNCDKVCLTSTGETLSLLDVLPGVNRKTTTTSVFRAWNSINTTTTTSALALPSLEGAQGAAPGSLREVFEEPLRAFSVQFVTTKELKVEDKQHFPLEVLREFVGKPKPKKPPFSLIDRLEDDLGEKDATPKTLKAKKDATPKTLKANVVCGLGVLELTVLGVLGHVLRAALGEGGVRQAADLEVTMGAALELGRKSSDAELKQLIRRSDRLTAPDVAPGGADAYAKRHLAQVAGEALHGVQLQLGRLLAGLRSVLHDENRKICQQVDRITNFSVFSSQPKRLEVLQACGAVAKPSFEKLVASMLSDRQEQDLDELHPALSRCHTQLNWELLVVQLRGCRLCQLGACLGAAEEVESRLFDLGVGLLAALYRARHPPSNAQPPRSLLEAALRLNAHELSEALKTCKLAMDQLLEIEEQIEKLLDPMRTM